MLAHLFHLAPWDIDRLRVSEYLIYVHAAKNWKALG